MAYIKYSEHEKNKPGVSAEWDFKNLAFATYVDKYNYDYIYVDDIRMDGHTEPTFDYRHLLEPNSERYDGVGFFGVLEYNEETDRTSYNWYAVAPSSTTSSDTYYAVSGDYVAMRGTMVGLSWTVSSSEGVRLFTGGFKEGEASLDQVLEYTGVPWFSSLDAAADYITHGVTDRAINADDFKDKSTALLNVVINFEHTTFEMRLSDLGELDSTEQKVKSANMIITGDNGGTFSKVVSMGDFETFSVSDLRNGGISTSDLKNNTFKVSAVFTNIDNNSVSVTPIAPAEPQATSESTLGSNKVVLTLRSSGTVSGDRDNDNSSDSDVDLNTLDDLDAQNILTTTYQMTKAELESFGGLLWDLDLETVGYRFINDNPIENVVSLKMIPFNSGVGDEKNIKLGNVDMGISANTAAKLTKKIFSGEYGKQFTIVNPLKNSTYEFLSYGSNAHLSIHLPFFGVVDLASELIGCEMAVQYVVDFINGECSVFLTRLNKINDTDGKEIIQDMHQLIYSATTNIGYEIPLFATNRAAKEQAIADTTDANKIAAVKAVGGVISGTAGALASKNPISMMGTAMEFMTSEKTRELTLRQAQEIGMSVSQKGSTGGVTAINQPTDIYYTVTYPNYYEPADFEKKNGRPCMKNVKISELETTDQGFHKMHKSLKVTGINAPEDIKQDIYNILTSGFYF